MAAMIFRFSLMLLVANCTIAQSLVLQPNGTVTLECGKQQQLICTTTADMSWNTGTSLTDCNTAGSCTFASVGHYSFSRSGSNCSMTFNPLKSIDNGKTFSCTDAGGGAGQVVITSKVNFDKASTSVSEQVIGSSVIFKLTTNCINPAASAKYQWKTVDSKTLPIPAITTKTDSSACLGECTGEKLIVSASFPIYSTGDSVKIQTEVIFDGTTYTFDSQSSYIVFEDSSSSSNNLAAGLGSGAGCLVVIAGVIGGCLWWKKKKPNPVRNLKGSPKPNEIKVEWKYPEGDAASLLYKASCQELGGTLQVIPNIKETEHTFESLNPGKIYVLNVYAVNIGFPSVESEPSTILIRTESGEGVPKCVENVTSEVSKDNKSIQVKWKPTNNSDKDSVRKFLVTWAQVFYEDGVVKEMYAEQINGTEFSIEDLISGMLYDVRVYERNTNGYSEPSTKLSRTKPNGVVPKDIVNETATKSKDSTTIKAEWQDCPGVDHYLVSWQQASTQLGNATGQTSNVEHFADIKMNWFLIERLHPGTEFIIGVYAKNAAGYSLPSMKSSKTSD